MKKIVLIFIISYLNAAELENISVQLLWKHQFESAGFYMAKEKGFYKDIGLNVTLKEYSPKIDVVKDVINQKSDFAVGSSSIILDRINGLDVYLLMPFLQKSPLVIMTKKRTDINKLSDLKNKRVMLADSQISMASLNSMFKVNNINKDDYILINHSFNINDLMDNKVDGMSVYLSNEPYYLIKDNMDYKIFNPTDYGFNFYENILFTSKKLLNSNPKLVEKFYEATLKGWKYAYNNIDETVKIIYSNYNTQNKSIEHLLFEAKELKKLSHFGFNDFTKFKPEVLNQMIQSFYLLNLTDKVINIDEFLYPNSIFKENRIDLTTFIRILSICILCFLGFYFWNRQLVNMHRKIQINQEKLLLVFNNVGQGFLSFKNDFLIQNEYSKECVNIFEMNIVNQNISELLFENRDKQIFFRKTLLLALYEHNNIRRKSYLSLLPKIVCLKSKILKLEYSIADDNIFVLVLTDITKVKKLEEKVFNEKKNLKMIVSIVSEPLLFNELINDYENFIFNELDISDIHSLYQIVHTFKGNFSQFFMDDIVESLHNFENLLLDVINKKEDVKIQEYDFKTIYNKNKNMLIKSIGNDIFQYDSQVKLDRLDILDLENKVKRFIENNGSTKECDEIYSIIRNLSKHNLYSLLKPYKFFVSNLALKLNKEIEELILVGKKEIFVDAKFKPFIKSLMHVFRNALDHGIEYSEERLKLNKPEKAIILCEFKEEKNYLTIIIKDDGKGIDVDRICTKAFEFGLDLSSLSESEILEIIFYKNISAKDIASSVSGRGIGLSVVLSEVEKLNGKISITTKKNEGVTFEFKIPKN